MTNEGMIAIKLESKQMAILGKISEQVKLWIESGAR